MALENARAYLTNLGYEDRIHTFELSSATVELAAVAIGTQPARIAKSLTFKVNGRPVMIVCAGDAKVSNSKYKAFFGVKATMLKREEVCGLIGHDVGGVCPFAIKPGVRTFLESLRRFEIIYPACGNGNSMVELTPEELEKLSNSRGWTDVCIY